MQHSPPCEQGAGGKGSTFAPSAPLLLMKELLPAVPFPRPQVGISHFKTVTIIRFKMPSNCMGSVLCKVVQLAGAWPGLGQQQDPSGDAITGRLLKEHQPPWPASKQRWQRSLALDGGTVLPA